MLWSDPWIEAATAPGGTDLPPPVPELPAGIQFTCVQAASLDIAEWRGFIGSDLSVQQIAERIGDDWVCCLRGPQLIATCVLRGRGSTWILETLFARERGHGYGNLLVRSAITWIWRRSGRFTLVYTWELSVLALAGAWWRGWLCSAVAIQRGWILRNGPCGFCSDLSGGRFNTPVLFRDSSGSAVVLDSGLGDGCGYVQMWRGEPSWDSIMKRGSWSSLWYRGYRSPPGSWAWTGEFIVIGALNAATSIQKEWISAEISTPV
jgi:hypothetical protein